VTSELVVAIPGIELHFEENVLEIFTVKSKIEKLY